MKDWQALVLLKLRGIIPNRRGVLWFRDGIQRPLTDEEAEAIEYLCDEWDYAFHPTDDHNDSE